jgi:hypothetical protein
VSISYAAVKQAVTDAINPAFFDFVAQMAHFFTWYAISLTLLVFWGWKGGIVASVVCVAYASIHEFVWDPRMENQATRGSDVRDFFFLLFGNAVSWIAWEVAHRFGRL